MSIDRPTCIEIEDLPPLEPLSEEEQQRILGAGQRARLGIEALETRDLMASSLTASLGGGLLRIEGTPGADTIRVAQSNGQIKIEGIAIQSDGSSVAAVAASSVS